MQVGELCQRLGVPYRHARYVLEQGILPAGVAEKPGKGDHRQLTPAQAYWLGIVLKLKESGIKTPLAGQIADYAQQAVRGVAGNLNWEGNFNPFLGQMQTEFQWYVEIGDLRQVRIVTTANPSQEGTLHAFPWRSLGAKSARAVLEDPVVTLRLDLGRLAFLLA